MTSRFELAFVSLLIMVTQNKRGYTFTSTATTLRCGYIQPIQSSDLPSRDAVSDRRATLIWFIGCAKIKLRAFSFLRIPVRSMRQRRTWVPIPCSLCFKICRVCRLLATSHELDQSLEKSNISAPCYSCLPWKRPTAKHLVLCN